MKKKKNVGETCGRIYQDHSFRRCLQLGTIPWTQPDLRPVSPHSGPGTHREAQCRHRRGRTETLLPQTSGSFFETPEPPPPALARRKGTLICRVLKWAKQGVRRPETARMTGSATATRRDSAPAPLMMSKPPGDNPSAMRGSEPAAKVRVKPDQDRAGDKVGDARSLTDRAGPPQTSLSRSAHTQSHTHKRSSPHLPSLAGRTRSVRYRVLVSVVLSRRRDEQTVGILIVDISRQSGATQTALPYLPTSGM